MFASTLSAARRLAVLRFIAAVLSGDGDRLATPGPAFSWDALIEVADELAVAPALWGALRGQAGTPDSVGERLRERYVATAIRNVRLKHQLRAATSALNRAGVEPLLFKGALALVDGTFETIGTRWMADLDLAVPADRMPAAERALRSIGYRPFPGKPFLHPHEVPFFAPQTVGPIELHDELGGAPLPSVLPFAEAWSQSVPQKVGDARARGLSPTHQVLHNVLHSAVQDLNHATGGLPLRQLIELARLARVHGRAVDWTEIGRRMQRHGLGDELNQYVALAGRIAGMPLPPESCGHPKRLREAWVLASFALGWPAEVQRNLRYAFGRAYLDSLYEHGDQPFRLAAARCRHALALLRRQGRGAIRQTLIRRV